MAEDLFLGTDTGGTGIKYVVVDSAGQPVDQGEVATDPASIPVSMQRLAAAVAAWQNQIRAVGMACAGIIDPEQGTLGRSPNLPGWQYSNLSEQVVQVFGQLPVVLANDVNAALYGEFRNGAGRGCQNLVMMALGTGVGGAVVQDGKLVLGSHYGAGEIGHTMLDPNGPTCTCGNPGCLEAYAGSVGLLKRAKLVAKDASEGSSFRGEVESHGASLTTRNLAEMAEGGDETARAIFAWAGTRLGQSVGNLINIMDPDKVIIGGGVARAGDLILGPCREFFPKLVLSDEAAKTPVVPAELGTLAASIGAANLAIEKLAQEELTQQRHSERDTP